MRMLATFSLLPPAIPVRHYRWSGDRQFLLYRLDRLPSTISIDGIFLILRAGGPRTIEKVLHVGHSGGAGGLYRKIRNVTKLHPELIEQGADRVAVKTFRCKGSTGVFAFLLETETAIVKKKYFPKGS